MSSELQHTPENHQPVNLTRRGWAALGAGVCAIGFAVGYGGGPAVVWAKDRAVVVIDGHENCTPDGLITLKPGETDWEMAQREFPNQRPDKTLLQVQEVNPHFEPGETHSESTINRPECE